MSGNDDNNKEDEQASLDDCNHHLSVVSSSDESVGDLRTLLDWGADANFRDFKGRTPLGYAIQGEAHHCLKLLLERGANPNKQVDLRTGKTPLQAIFDRRMEYDEEVFVELLLQHGADPNTTLVDRSNNKKTSLLGKILAYRVETIGQLLELCLEKGADPNAPCDETNQHRPLHMLRVEGSNQPVLPLVQSLLRHGANPNLRNVHGCTALHVAVQRATPIPSSQDATETVQVVRALLHQGGADPNMIVDSPKNDNDLPPDKDGKPPLWFPLKTWMCYSYDAEYARFQVAWALLEHGADPCWIQPQATTNNTPPQCKDNMPFLEEMKRWYHNYKDEKYYFRRKGRQLVYFAMVLGLYDIVMQELDHKTQQHDDTIDQVMENGRTLLFYPCMRGNASLVQQLLNRGANPRVANVQGKTPLDCAAARGHLEVVEILSLALLA